MKPTLETTVFRQTMPARDSGTPPLKKRTLAISGAFTTTCRVLAPPPLARVLVEGIGLVSLAGESAVRIEKQVNFNHAHAPQVGTMRITSKTGESLHAEFDARRVPHEAECVDPFAGIFVISGGTGRFDQASGQLEFCGYTHFSRLGADGAGLFSFKGTICLADGSPDMP
jgi:hypothetical protein